MPVGYNDGVPWRLSNKGSVLVRGHRAPIVGRVSMDYITVDVGHIPGVHVGDMVTLIGNDGGETISVEEIARHVDTIAYEILLRRETRAAALRRRRVDRARKQSAPAPSAPSVRTWPPPVRGHAELDVRIEHERLDGAAPRRPG